MPTIITRGAGSAQGLGYASSSAEAAFIEDVFSTYLYTGNGSTQTITNGIDLSGKGGLTWIKSRTTAFNHTLVDTVRGATNLLVSNTTAAQATQANSLTAFTSTGFSIGAGSIVNYLDDAIASWTFRKQPKFFDVVTYTGDGTNRTIAHNLGSVPGCVIVKRLNDTGSWFVWHRSLGSEDYIQLQSTGAAVSGFTNIWGPMTSTTFGVDNNAGACNISGATYVAYLFAHDAGGFGLTGTDNVISCGSFTTSGAGTATVNLGYEPQWLMLKNSTSADNWYVLDNMRGFSMSQGISLNPNTSSAESDYFGGNTLTPNATGFSINNNIGAGATWIYVSLRRGPMKVPTSGTSVYNAISRTGTGADVTVTGIGFTPDLLVDCNTDATANEPFRFWFDRLRGSGRFFASNNTLLEAGSTNSVTGFDVMNAIKLGTSERTNFSALPYINWFFRRAPGFFDEVCYTGTQVVRTVTHNLGAVPELIITKGRSGARDWYTYNQTTGNGKFLLLSSDINQVTSGIWDNTSPTSTVFTLAGPVAPNVSGETYVAYLFASCPGVSKVGSYTGTGTTQVINCGFTSGSRFIMIKRTDAAGDWYVWDSARGIVAGNDPYLWLNSTAAEVTNTDYVDTAASGFEISSTAPAAINANGGSFIFLAVS